MDEEEPNDSELSTMRLKTAHFPTLPNTVFSSARASVKLITSVLLLAILSAASCFGPSSAFAAPQTFEVGWSYVFGPSTEAAGSGTITFDPTDPNFNNPGNNGTDITNPNAWNVLGFEFNFTGLPGGPITLNTGTTIDSILLNRGGVVSWDFTTDLIPQGFFPGGVADFNIFGKIINGTSENELSFIGDGTRLNLTVFRPLGLVSPAASASPGQQSAPVPTVLVTNLGAISSAETTGLNSISTTLSSVQNAVQNAVVDLNNRIFNARSGGTQSGNGNGVASTLDNTSRYLNFAQNQNIDYRVALGLADGETVEVVDTLSGLGAGAGHPFAMVGVPVVTGSAVIAVEGGSGKNSVTDKVVIEEASQAKFEVFSSFDYGYYDQDNLTRNSRGFEVDSYAGSAGLEMRLTDWLVAGTAFTYLESNTNSTANLGSGDLNGEVYSVYATAFHGNTYLDVLYSYGDFDNDISRNTLLGRTAYGDTESHSHNIDLNLGHTIEVNDRFSFGPSAGLNYTTGEVDGYNERNGGSANLIYPDHDFESMIGRLGGYATFKCNTAAGLLTTQASASWAHEFDPENGNVTASLETSPFALVTGNSARSTGGYTAEQERAHAGADWLELGATTRLDISNTGFNFELGYQGMFGRTNASGHFGSAKIGYEW